MPRRRGRILTVAAAVVAVAVVVVAGTAVAARSRAERPLNDPVQRARKPNAVPPSGGQIRGLSSSYDFAQLAPTSGGATGARTFSAAPGRTSEKIVTTGSITIEVRRGRFDRAWDAALRLIAEKGGAVTSSQRGQPTTVRGSEPVSGRIVIRVPAARFDEMMGALRALGTVRGDSSDSLDVTEEYVDLEAQVRSLRAEQTALRRLFDRARSVKDTLAVQTRLSAVQGQIERSTGRIRFLNSRTENSYITLNIGEPGSIAPTIRGRSNPSLSQAIDTAGDGLVRIGTALLIATIWLAPFAAAALAMYALRRSRRKARAETQL